MEFLFRKFLVNHGKTQKHHRKTRKFYCLIPYVQQFSVLAVIL